MKRSEKKYTKHTPATVLRNKTKVVKQNWLYTRSVIVVLTVRAYSTSTTSSDQN